MSRERKWRAKGEGRKGKRKLSERDKQQNSTDNVEILN